MSTRCVPMCACLYNLQQGCMIMLGKLFQKHEKLFVTCLLMKKAARAFFGNFMTLGSIKYFFAMSFLTRDYDIKWPKVPSGINLPTLG